MKKLIKVSQWSLLVFTFLAAVWGFNWATDKLWTTAKTTTETLINNINLVPENSSTKCISCLKNEASAACIPVCVQIIDAEDFKTIHPRLVGQ